MEKTFQRMKDRPTARDAYVRAEVSTALAHQVRAIRNQRGWTQADLAKLMGTTQAVVSRLEDPSYGRVSLATLFDLSKAFDTGLQVKFVSLTTMLQETFNPSHAARLVPSFEEEAPYVAFVSKSVASSYVVASELMATAGATSMRCTAVEAPALMQSWFANVIGPTSLNMPAPLVEAITP